MNRIVSGLLGVACCFGLTAFAEAGMVSKWTMDDAQADMFLVGAGPHGHPDDALDTHEGLYYSYSGAGGVIGDPQFNIISVPGQVGSSADFGGADGTDIQGHNAHAVVNSSAIIAQDTTSSVAAWFQANTLQAGRKWIYLDSGVFGLNIDGDRAQVAYNNGGWVYESSSFTLSTDTWYYAAISRNGATIDLHVIEGDGTVHTDSFNFIGAMNAFSTGQVIIGGAGVSENFGGIIDEVTIWDDSVDIQGFVDDSGVIPEPASVALMGLGGLLMLCRRRS